MAEQTSGTQAGQQTNSGSAMGASPGGKPMGAIGISLITVYLTLVTIVVFHSLVVLWPPNREVLNDDTQAILDRLDKLEGSQPAGGKITTETAGEISPGNTGTTEPMGSDLGEEALGTDAAPMGSDLGSGSAPAKPKEKGGQPEEMPKKKLVCTGGQVHTELFWFMNVCLSDEERLFLIVIFAGALGGLVHSLRSFFWYAGCRRLVLSWAGFYITLPVLGATMATVFYLVIRGGFFSPQSDISDTSPFGFAALAALIGMFTEQAAQKLKEITETIFATAPQGSDHAEEPATAPTITAIAENHGPQAGGTPVTITGTGFAQGATVTFGGQPATDVQAATDGTSITAKTPPAAAPGSVAVEVTNPDGKKVSLANGFTYDAAGVG